MPGRARVHILPPPVWPDPMALWKMFSHLTSRDIRRRTNKCIMGSSGIIRDGGRSPDHQPTRPPACPPHPSAGAFRPHITHPSTRPPVSPPACPPACPSIHQHACPPILKKVLNGFCSYLKKCLKIVSGAENGSVRSSSKMRTQKWPREPPCFRPDQKCHLS